MFASKSIFTQIPAYIPRESLPSLSHLAALVFLGLPLAAVVLNVAYQLVSFALVASSWSYIGMLCTSWRSLFAEEARVELHGGPCVKQVLTCTIQLKT